MTSCVGLVNTYRSWAWAWCFIWGP